MPGRRRTLYLNDDAEWAQFKRLADPSPSAVIADSGIKARLCDETGELRHFVNIYVNGEDIRYLDGIETSLSNSDEVSIVPAVAGG